MNLSYFTLRRLCQELNEILQGKRFRRAALSGTYELAVETTDGICLLLSATPNAGRMQRVHRPPAASRPPPPWVEHHLCDNVVLGISQIPLERVLSFTLCKRDRLGGERRYRMYVELIHRYSNVILTSESDQRILGVLRRAGEKTNRHRRILPGATYRLPPEQDRILPHKLAPADLADTFRQRPDQPVRALTGVVAGLDVLTAASLVAETGVEPNVEPAPETIRNLVGRIQTVFTHPPFLDQPEILSIPGSPPTIRVLSLRHGPGDVEQVCESVSDAIARVALMEENRAHVDSDRREIVTVLNRRRTSLKSRITRIQSDLDDSENAERYRRYGHILLAGLHRIRLGNTSVTLPDVYNPSGPPVTIPLRPNKLPHENAAAYLKRSRKVEKARPILTRRREDTRKDLAGVDAFLERLNRADSPDEVTKIRNELAGAGWLKSRTRKANPARNSPAETHPRRYRTSDGWTVLVGRNNLENDHLTKGSSKDDLFFHAQGCPGSHVILKREGKRQEPSETALNEAASLAAYWSKARNSRTVPVNCTEVRYVQKPRGAAPGLVNIRNEVTLFVAPRQLRRTEA
ncbi:MAG: NFACT family protein [Candidatus Latescibacteria bacterium]|nr:NFACT family protein [Candidatus Latescibacterota bacterium]